MTSDSGLVIFHEVMFRDPLSGYLFCLRCLRRANFLPPDWPGRCPAEITRL
jgi:hypothetical protein